MRLNSVKITQQIVCNIIDLPDSQPAKLCLEDDDQIKLWDRDRT
jgi:hypothetical protein